MEKEDKLKEFQTYNQRKMGINVSQCVCMSKTNYCNNNDDYMTIGGPEGALFYCMQFWGKNSQNNKLVPRPLGQRPSPSPLEKSWIRE